MPIPDTIQTLQNENASLKDKLREYEETLHAIRSGEVDALVVAGKKGEQIYTLKGAEHPYRAFIEHMNEGAVTLNPEGVILYSNPRFGKLVKQPVQTLIGKSFIDNTVSPRDRGIVRNCLTGESGENKQAEITLRSSDATTFPAKISVSVLHIEEAVTFCVVVTDLTERRQKEEFRTLAENSPDIIMRINRQLRVLYANPATAEIYGSAITGKNVSELSRKPEETAFWQKMAQRAFETAKNAQYVFQYMSPKGDTYYFDARVIPELNDKGQVVSSLSIARDITARKNAEDAVRASEATLNAFFENSPISLAIRDEELRYIKVDNRSARNYYGLKPEEMVGKKPGELIPEVGTQDDPLARRVLENGETVQAEINPYFPSLRKRIEFMTVYFPIILVNNKRGIGTISVDITERKKAEDTLRRNEYELKSVVENTPDIYFRLNRQQQYVFINPTYERLTGLMKEQLIGRTNSQLGMPRQLAQFWQSEVQEAFESGKEHTAEFEMSGFFGKRYFSARLIPEFEKTGLVETVLVVARDITDKKLVEEEIASIKK